MVEPKSRGLDKTNVMETKADGNNSPVVIAPTRIVKVNSFGSGWIAVVMDDGKQYKRWDGTLAWRYNNPGNLKYGAFASRFGAVGSGHDGLAVFPTLDAGREAHRSLLFASDSSYRNMTLLDACRRYAPYSDNNDPDAYAHYVARACHVSFLKTLKDFSADEQSLAIQAFSRYEGFRSGNIGLVKT